MALSINLLTWLRNRHGPRYDVKASNYNPNIGGSVTITVTAYNVDGTTISNHTFNLTLPDGSTTSLTTDNNGVATYSYTCDSWGVRRFSVGTYDAVINVLGWKTALYSTNYTVMYNQDYVHVSVHVAESSSYTTTYSEFGNEVLKDGNIDLRPSCPMSVIQSNGNILMIKDNSYKVGKFRLSGTGSGSAYGVFLYKRR